MVIVVYPVPLIGFVLAEAFSSSLYNLKKINIFVWGKKEIENSKN